MATELVVPRHRWSRASQIFDRWLSDDGDWVRKWSPVCTLDVNGVNLPVAADKDGFLTITATKLTRGQKLVAGTVLGYVTRPSESVPIDPRQVTTVVLPKRVLVPALAKELRQTWQPPPKDRAASPRARKTARELGVPLRAVRGTGYRGRITLRDVFSAAPAILASGGATVPAWCGVEVNASDCKDAGQYKEWAQRLAAKLIHQVTEQDFAACRPWDVSALQLVTPSRVDGMTTFHEILVAQKDLGKLVAEEDVRTNMIPVYLAASPATTVYMPPLPPGALFAIGISAVTERPIFDNGKVIVGYVATLTVVFDSERLGAEQVETWLSVTKMV